MIRPIDIRLNAAHPELPLAEAVTFTGSPSTVLIRGVPPNCGRWAITAVFVAATFPDGSTTTRAAVQSANGVWVATLPATATSGRTANGLRVMADGIDESGAAVTGYILGVADFAVASLGVTPAPEPGETSWQMLYFDAVPGALRKGDVAKVDGVLKLYNGTAWEPFSAPVTFDDAVTPTSANGVKSSGIWSAIWGALSALPTGFSSLYDWVVAQLAGKASKADATLTESTGFNAWVTKSIPEGLDVDPENDVRVTWGDPMGSYGYEAWYFDVIGDPTGIGIYWTGNTDYNATSLSQDGFTATRTALQGYQLGDQDDKSLASEAEAEALRTGKLDKSGGTMTGPLTVPIAEGLHFGDQFHTMVAQDIQRNKYLVLSDGTNGIAIPIKNGTTALTAEPNHAGNLAALDADGNPTDSQIPKTDVALKGNIPYDLVTKSITSGAVTLDDRASNSVTVSATLSPNTLTINFPTAPTGKLRDFAMRLNIAAGVTAPEIAWPQGVTLENNGGEVPEIADGGTGGSSTILYFSESENNETTAKFTVKGETLVAITPQA